MDFRTEWSSWVLLAIMFGIAYFIYPYGISNNIPIFLAWTIGIPLATVALACIPVLVGCYFIKVIPDIDFSIRLGFLYMLMLLVSHFIA